MTLATDNFCWHIIASDSAPRVFHSLCMPSFLSHDKFPQGCLQASSVSEVSKIFKKEFFCQYLSYTCSSRTVLVFLAKLKYISNSIELFNRLIVSWPLPQRFPFGSDNLKNILVRAFKFGMWVYMGNVTNAIVL